MLQWCIVYRGLSTYSDVDGSPFDAPGTGVQAVVIADGEHGHCIIHGCDAYWYDEGTWFGLMDKHGWGLWDYLAEPGPKKVVRGKTTATNREFQDALKAAQKIAVEHFPPKSALAPIEAAL